MSVADEQQDDLSLVALLFEAGQQGDVSSDAIMDVLLESLKTGRSVEEVVGDHEILSRRQRDSIQSVISQRSLPGKTDGVTCRRANDDTASDPIRSREDSVPDERSKLDRDLDELLPVRAARYENLQEIGRGGWGVVQRARDHQLNRDVAIKQLSAAAGAGSDVARRFMREAAITAQLQHPGIVPVYERGLNPQDQQPFYAMKLLSHTTLRDIIRDYHENSDSTKKHSLLQRMLKCYVDVCQAIAFAHEQGIIHRDLKPSNVVVGEFGETVVVDWGLARHIEAAEKANSAELNEATLPAGTPQPAATSRAAAKLNGLLEDPETQRGSVIGTPAFMSPEQARGDAVAIQPASDIYSLGVILYVMLTGRPPFHGDDVTTTMKLVIAGQYAHPREINRRIPAALASVCTRAMSTDPAERYASAADIATEISRFQLGEHVHAHAETKWERIGRWCRRYPAAAVATMTTMLILTVAACVSSVMISAAHKAERTAKESAIAARNEEATARAAAESARATALLQLQESRRATDEWLLGLSGTLGRFPGLQTVRRDLIEQARSHYTEVLESAGSDPLFALEAARAQIRLGDLALMTGDVSTAVESFSLAASQLVEQKDDHSKLEQFNAVIGLSLCTLQSDVAADEAETQLRSLIEEFSSLIAPTAEHYNSLARAELVAARMALRNGLHHQAERDFALALRHAERLQEAVNSSQSRYLLATVRQDFADALNHPGKRKQSAQLRQELIDTYSVNLKDAPERPDLLESRAVARMQWANAQRELGEDWAAEGAYREAVKDLSAAWQLLYGDHFFNENLAVAQANLGQLAMGLNRPEDAEQLLRDAIDQLTGLLQSGQADYETASRLAGCNVSLGQILVYQGDPAAEEQIKRSLEIFQYLDAENVSGPADRAAHARAMANLGRWYALAQESTQAKDWLYQSESAFRQLTESASDPAVVATATRDLALAEFDRADILRETGQAAQADALESSATARLKQIAAKETLPQRSRQHSATVTLLQRLLDMPRGEDDLALAAELLEAMDQPAASAHIQQLHAILLLRHDRFSDAAETIRRAQSGRRVADAIDTAISGSIAVLRGESGNSDLASVDAELKRCPGNRRLRVWAGRLAEFLSSVQPDSAGSAQQ